MRRCRFYGPRALVSTLFLAGAMVLSAEARTSGNEEAGVVYVATNDADANEIVTFTRLADGSLAGSQGTFATGGEGTGGSLGNQSGLVLTDDERFLVIINAGSHQISVFEVLEDGLMLRDIQSSGGVRPISLAVHDDLLFVLHAGGLEGAKDSIAGFHLQQDGGLEAIHGSARPLSQPSADPAQIDFSADGSVLVVTEKATNMITTYLVGCQGRVGDPNPQPSAGMTPFGFGFGMRGQLFVSEAFGGARDASAVSSYVV